MFNSKLKQKIASLEDTVTRQSILLSEKERALHDAFEKLYYTEGQAKAQKEVVEILREQLKAETIRVNQLQSTWLAQQAISSEILKQDVSSLYEEDENIVNDIHSKYEDDGEL